MKKIKAFNIFEREESPTIDVNKVNEDIITEISIIRDFFEILQEKFPKGNVTCTINCSSIWRDFDTFSNSVKKLIESKPDYIIPTIQYTLSVKAETKDDFDIRKKVDNLMDQLQHFDSNCEISQFSFNKVYNYRTEKYTEGNKKLKLRPNQSLGDGYLTTEFCENAFNICLTNKKARYNPKWVK